MHLADRVAASRGDCGEKVAESHRCRYEEGWEAPGHYDVLNVERARDSELGQHEHDKEGDRVLVAETPDNDNKPAQSGKDKADH